MGGPGKPGTTTPEDLFAVGYAACFGSAVEFFGHQLKLKPTSIEINHAVGVGFVDGAAENGFGLVVDIEVKIAGLSQEDADKLVEAAHSGCPYSRAIKGNVPVTLKVTVV
jgi:Ohr subfamily peroxiredoxin